MSDVAEVARSLTKAQRYFIASRTRLVYRSGPLSDAFVEAGILVKGGGNWTPLGLAVRQYLQENPNA